MNKPITTTLNAVRECLLPDYLALLLKGLGKTEPDDEPLRFSTIMKATHFYIAYRCLESLPKEHEPSILRLIADKCERIVPLFKKQYPQSILVQHSIQATRNYAEGKITKKQWQSARQIYGPDHLLTHIRMIKDDLYADTMKPGTAEYEAMYQLLIKHFR